MHAAFYWVVLTNSNSEPVCTGKNIFTDISGINANFKMSENVQCKVCIVNSNQMYWIVEFVSLGRGVQSLCTFSFIRHRGACGVLKNLSCCVTVFNMCIYYAGSCVECLSLILMLIGFRLMFAYYRIDIALTLLLEPMQAHK